MQSINSSQKNCVIKSGKPYFCAKEVADLLDISESMLAMYRSQRANKGQVPKHKKIGKRIQYKRSDLEEWIRQQN